QSQHTVLPSFLCRRPFKPKPSSPSVRRRCELPAPPGRSATVVLPVLIPVNKCWPHLLGFTGTS
ncbi:hypothetical protein U9M48_004298, partial [Paspalum notatum var. saurae]